VDLTLKELRNVLEKHGVVAVDALRKPFDPTIHHAMSQIETDDAEENTVIKEFRKGYMFRDRVLRAAMVGVAKKPSTSENIESDNDQNETVPSDNHQDSDGKRT
jgi:molecular chaperone GrpE